MTTEGGGAIAFPVMTLAMHIQPTVARDFSMMIQSCGCYYYLDSNLLHSVEYVPDCFTKTGFAGHDMVFLDKFWLTGNVENKTNYTEWKLIEKNEKKNEMDKMYRIIPIETYSTVPHLHRI